MQATCSIPTEQQLQPLGPESLTWRYFGDLRGLLLISRVGLLQNLHPSLAAGVQDHSDLFLNPWNRLFRSIPPILAVVYGGKQATATGQQIRDRLLGRRVGGGHYLVLLSPCPHYWCILLMPGCRRIIRQPSPFPRDVSR